MDDDFTEYINNFEEKLCDKANDDIIPMIKETFSKYYNKYEVCILNEDNFEEFKDDINRIKDKLES